MSDLSGIGITILRGSDGGIQSATDAAGRTATFTFKSGLISAIALPGDGRCPTRTPGIDWKGYVAGRTVDRVQL